MLQVQDTENVLHLWKISL